MVHERWADRDLEGSSSVLNVFSWPVFSLFVDSGGKQIVGRGTRVFENTHARVTDARAPEWKKNFFIWWQVPTSINCFYNTEL